MSYTYLQESGEESSAASFSDIPASVLSRLSHIAEKCSSKDNEMESFQSSQSGTTLKPLMENHGEDLLKSSAEGFLVRILALLEKERELMEKNQDCGKRWLESFSKLDLGSFLWKTRQCLLFEDLEQSLEIWPKWGIMLYGVCSRLPMLEHVEIRERIWILARKLSGVSGKGLKLSWKPFQTMGRKFKYIPWNERPESVLSRLRGVDDGVPRTVERQIPLETVKYLSWLRSHIEP